jgi:hypothetical protein
MARTITFFACVPVIMKPPISALSPVSTRRRVEILPKSVGVDGPVGRKRTDPRPREVLASPEIGTLEVTEELLNGARTKIAGSVMLPPARIANWLSALMPTSSNASTPAGSGIFETVELLVNGAAMPAA